MQAPCWKRRKGKTSIQDRNVSEANLIIVSYPVCFYTCRRPIWYHLVLLNTWLQDSFHANFDPFTCFSLCLEKFQDPDQLTHPGPLAGVMAEALVGQHGHHLSPLGTELPLEPWVHDVVLVLAQVLQHRPRPLREVLLSPGPRLVHHHLAREELQQDHPEAVHVTHHRQVTCKWGLINTFATVLARSDIMQPQEI